MALALIEDILDAWFDDGWGARIVIIVVALVILSVPGIVYLMIKEDHEWERFKVAHKCKVVERIKGSVNVGIDSKGKTIIIPEADKTSWLCDDGITYTR